MNLLHLAILLTSIETGGHKNPNEAIGDNGRAVGSLQTHPIMVREVNRIIKRPRFTYYDRHDHLASLSMCVTFLNHQRKRHAKRFGCDPTKAQLMQSWNSGSIFKPCTVSYGRKVNDKLKRRK